MKYVFAASVGTGLLLASGCTPAKLTRLPVPSESERAEVLVYRESAFNAMAVSLVFGEDERDYVSLNQNQYAELQVPAGMHNFFVRGTQADQPYVLAVPLQAGQKRCLKAYANPTNYLKALFPISYYFGYAFLFEPAHCPSQEELATYAAVAVDYLPAQAAIEHQSEIVESSLDGGVSFATEEGALSSPVSTPTPLAAGKITTVSVAATLHQRAADGTATLRDVLPVGTEVQLVSSRADKGHTWWWVRAGAREGWILESELEGRSF